MSSTNTTGTGDLDGGRGPGRGSRRSWLLVFVVGVLIGAVVAAASVLATVALLQEDRDVSAERSDDPAPTAPAQRPTGSPAPAPAPEDGPVTPAPAGFPGPDDTGVPEGVELTKSDALVVTEDGAVLENLHITGSVKVEANDVTIRNSLIDATTSRYPVQVMGEVTGLVIEDSEIDGNGTGTIAILKKNYTLRRVDIHSVMDGPRIEGANVLIEDSWIHDLTRVEGGHHDAIQIRQGSNIRITGNTLVPYKASTGDPMNAAIQIGSLMGPMTDLVVAGNYLDGGNYTINGGSSWVTKATYRNNRFGRNYRYGVKTNLGGGSTWESSNVFDDSSKAAK